MAKSVAVEEGKDGSEVRVAGLWRAVEVLEELSSFARMFVCPVKTGVLAYIHWLLPTVFKFFM